MAKREQLFKIDQDYRYGNRIVYRSVGGLSGGSITTHALSDTSIHTGTLLESQAPWAITTTIFAAHVADPNVHHAQAHDIVGADHTATGSQYDVIGLITTNTLGVMGSTTDSSQGGNFNKLLRADVTGGTKVSTLTAGTSVVTPTLTASADLSIDPTGNVVFPNAQTLVTPTFSSGFPIAGWSIFQANSRSNLTIGGIQADELRVRLFVADEVRVDRGEVWIGPSYGIVAANFVSPSAINGTVTAFFEDSPAINGAIFSNGDYLSIRIFDDSVGLSIATLWFTVSGYVDQPNNQQSWVLTLKAGSTNYQVRKSQIAISWGKSGQGIIHTSVVDPSGAPYTRFFTWVTDPTNGANQTTTLRIGVLHPSDNTTLNPSGVGIYSSNAYLSGDFIAGNGNVRIYQNSGINIQEDDAASWTTIKAIEWWPNINNRTGSPTFVVRSGKLGFDNSNQINLYASPTGGVQSTITVASFDQNTSRNDNAVITMRGASVSGQASSVVINSSALTVASPLTTSGKITAGGNIERSAGGTKDLGTAGVPFDTLYIHAIVADTISGSTALGGPIWQNDAGDMYIRSSSASNRTLFVANPHATGTMNLDVEGNITLLGTVDGVDVSTLNTSFTSLQSAYNLHIAQPDAHHARSHVFATTSGLGTDHTVSGLTAGYVLRASSATAAAFAQLSHADLGGVTANQHHNQIHVLATNAGLGGDHTISGATAGHALRATSATTATFSQIQHTDLGGVLPDQHHAQAHTMTGPDHIHAGGTAMDLFGLTVPGTIGVITPSSNPGAASAILKSTAAGGLTLQNLTVNGSVNILNGGDLTVGNNVLFVDVSTPNVGINRAPDIQFDLDVLGNFRAGGYIVGKHALQVKDALLIAHYDGKEPFDTDFTGEATGHRGQVPTISGGVIFREGLYNKAIQVAEATTNLITNPSFELGLATNWTNYNTGTGAGTRTVISTDSKYGNYCYQIAKTAGAIADNFGAYHQYAVVNGQSYTVSAWINVVAITGGTQTVRLQTDTNVTSVSVAQVGITNGWIRLSVTTSATATGNARLYVYIDDATSATIYVDAAQAENKAYCTEYCDGSLGLNPAQAATASENAISVGGYSWLTLNNASTSSRVAGSVSYVQAVPNTWTISLWAYREAKQAHSWGYLSGNANDYNAIYYNSSNFDVIGNVSAGVPTDGWHHYVLVANGVNRTAYRDGVLIGTNALGVTAGSTWYVGCNGGAYQGNALIDEFAIIGRALGAAEIRAIYESNAPIFAETSVYQFRVGNGLAWGDNEGLWMRDTAGNNVLGVSGVASKSWGGLVLDPGDFMLGSVTNGYLLYDASSSIVGLTLATAGSAYLTLEPLKGLTLQTNTSLVDDNRAITWATGASSSSHIKGYNGGAINALFFGVNQAVGLKSQINIDAWTDDGRAADILLTTHRGALYGAYSFLQIHDDPVSSESYVSASSDVITLSGVLNVGMGHIPGTNHYFGKTAIGQGNSSAAIPTLYLTQADVSEEFIEFNGTVATGNPIDTAAVGTFYGKIRVSVNGTAKYIALYNS
jgi:hypothetical protein